MPLKVELAPGERIIVGDCVIRNGNQRARFQIESRGPVLREKDILTAEDADTPARRIYLAVQLMYLSQDPSPAQDAYLKLVKDILAAAPSTFPYVERISNLVLTGFYYKALREAKALIAYEEELLGHAKSSRGCVWPDGADDGQPA